MRTLILLLIVILLTGCNRVTRENRNGKTRVVATTGMLYDVVLNVGGDHIEAEVLMGPGVDPHLYKATQGDLKRFNEADLIVYNGHFLEGKMSEILGKYGRQKQVIAAAEAVPEHLLISAEAYEEAYDPHVWFDVSRWKYVVRAIEGALSRIDTAHSPVFKKNSELYLSKLDSLDKHVKDKIAEIPEKQRILVTAHDAFVYFGDAYGVQVEGLQGISTVAEFGLRDVAELIDLIIENDIKAIFIETSVSEKSIQAVITGCKEKGHQVSIGGSLYSDAMGEWGTKEGTYIGMFKKNVEVITEALK